MFYTKSNLFFNVEISLEGFLPIFKETVEMLKKMDKMTCEKK